MEISKDLNMKCVDADLNNKSDGKNRISVSSGNCYGEHVKTCYNFEEALDLAGNGKYNISLLILMNLVLMSMGLDMFGFSVVVLGLNCDFSLTLVEKGILTSMPFAGVLLMCYPWGYFSDTQGRKKTLVLATGISFMAAVLCSFSPNWQILAVLKLITSSFSCAAQSVTFVLIGESCASRVRHVYMTLTGTALMMTPCFYYLLGYVILNLDFSYDLGFLGMRFTPWRLLSLLFALPLALCCLGLTFFYESPKFLTSQGNITEAVNILNKIFIQNNGTTKKFPVKDLILDEEGNARNVQKSFLKSVWSQTAPLFKPPLLLRTLQLYFLTVVMYVTNNSFTALFPFIADAFFSTYYGASQSEGSGLCHLLVGSLSNSTAQANITSNINYTCSSSLAYQTVVTGVIHSVSFTIINTIISRFSNRKKSITLLVLVLSAAASVACNLAPEPMSAMVMFIVFTLPSVIMVFLPAYYVQLFPTSYRGMVACLGVMVARLSSLAGINLVSSIIIGYCTTTFYSWSAFILIGVVVACFLPSDKCFKKV